MSTNPVFSLFMLLTTRGRDYSFSEIQTWLNAGGFEAIRMEKLPSPPFSSSIVIGRKPSR